MYIKKDFVPSFKPDYSNESDSFSSDGSDTSGSSHEGKARGTFRGRQRGRGRAFFHPVFDPNLAQPFGPNLIPFHQPQMQMPPPWGAPFPPYNQSFNQPRPFYAPNQPFLGRGQRFRRPRRREGISVQWAEQAATPQGPNTRSKTKEIAGPSRGEL